MIDYKKKLTTDKEFNPIDNLDYSIESDRGRIFSAPAFRRLHSDPHSTHPFARRGSDGTIYRQKYPHKTEA